MAFHIKTFVSSILQSKHDSWKIQLLDRWQDIMGTLSHHVTIERITHEMIILGVYDSCWLQELYLMSSTILETINQNLDQPRFKEIRFKQVSRKKKATQETAPTIITIPSITMTPQQEHSLAKIKDSELQSALRSFFMRCHRERKR